MDERYVQSGDASLWTCVEGGGPPIILCNGGPGCCDYLGPVAELLRDRYTVIRFEERGCGRSSFTPPYNFGQSVLDLDAIRTAYGFDQWTVIGHSAGADLALLHALQFSERTTSIIGLAGGRIVNDRSWSDAYKAARDAEGEPLPEQPLACDERVNPESNAWWRRFITEPALLARLSRLGVPAHFILAEHDIRPAWPTLQLAKLLPAGSAEVIVGARHLIWLDEPEQLGTAMHRVLDSLGGQTP